MKSHAIYLTQTPGRCRWCRCTEAEACESGCSWANRDRTLCSACVPLDAAMHNVPGRMELAVFLQVQGFVKP
jgi:hypothetical protein